MAKPVQTPEPMPTDRVREPAESGRGTKEQQVHALAMKRANEAWLAERDNVQEGRDCQKFYAGEQWLLPARQIRERDGRPVLTINRLPQFVRQMTGDLRKNPPSIKYLPAKAGASQETAEALNGITRNIEQQSNAKDCYVIATENAAIASQGFFRIVTEYSSDDDFDQDIRIRPIRDPFGCLLDPYAQLPDKSDCRYGFVFEHVSLEDFKATWPDKSADEIPIVPQGMATFPWRIQDSIRIAEYWERIPAKKTLYLLEDGAVTETEPKDGEPPAVKEREVDGWEVRSWLVSGKDVLSGPHEWAGKYIPICQVVGEEITMDSRTVRKGMTHDARDPQRVVNYTRSASVEAVALQPKSPFLLTVDQIKGYEPMWKTAGSKNHPYLVYNIDSKAPHQMPQRSPPPIASQGLDNQSAIAAADMEAVLGIYPASLGANSSEHSGIAIARKQQEGDTTTYLYPDNLARAIGYAGRILADLIPRIYDGERQVRILKEDGTPQMVTVNGPPPMGPPGQNAQGQPTAPEPLHPLYDLSAGEYDVSVTVGPTFATRRAEASANMAELVRSFPMLAQVAGDIIVKNMDFPGAEEIAARLAALMPKPGEQKPDPKVQGQALVDASTVELNKAKAAQIEIGNAVTLTQMHETLMAIQAFLQGGPPLNAGAPAGPAGPAPGAPPPGPPGGPPVPGLPMGGPNGPPAPMQQANGHAGIPTVELEGQ